MTSTVADPPPSSATPPSATATASDRSGIGARLRTVPVTRRGGIGGVIAVPVGDGHAAILAEGLGGDANARRRLAALVLGPVDQRGHAPHELGVEPGVDDLADGTVVDD